MMQAVLSMFIAFKGRKGDRTWQILQGVCAAGNVCANSGSMQPGIGIAFHNTADDKASVCAGVRAVGNLCAASGSC